MSAQTFPLTEKQRLIVEAPDGPAVVLAGAGTGKTRVIVERVRWLLETKGSYNAAGAPIPAEPVPTHGNPFEKPLVPEQILVLTYNVKAAAELQERLDQTVGAAVRARMTVQNFHGFCHHVLMESSADAGLPAMPDVLDGPAQVLLLRELRPSLDLLYYGDYAYDTFVKFISRAKDELRWPADLGAFVAAETAEYEARYGSYSAAVERLRAAGNLAPLRDVSEAYRGVRTGERAEAAGRPAKDYKPDAAEKIAEREARRTFAGDGSARPMKQFPEGLRPRILELADSYVRDGAALELLRQHELADVYRAYQDELVRRGVLDFGEQIALVARLFMTRPNVLRRWQRQYRYILVDEFQDANVAQIELIELLGRTPDRPDNVMVVGDDDQSIYRFRGASFAAFDEFNARFAKSPAHDPDAVPPGPPPILVIDENFRSGGHVLDGANSLIVRNETRIQADKRLRTSKDAGQPVELILCNGAEDEAVAIVDRIRELVGGSTGAGGGVPFQAPYEIVADKRNDTGAEMVPLGANYPNTADSGEGAPGAVRSGVVPNAGTTPAKPAWNSVAVLYRKHRHREAIVKRLHDENIPFTVVGGLSLFDEPEIRDLEQGLRAIADPLDDAALVRVMTAGPWRLDAIEILRVTRHARFDRSRVIEAVKRIVGSGQVRQDVLEGGENEDSRTAAIAPETRAKLRLLQDAIDELNPRTWRDGPSTVLTRYLERTGLILDLLAAGTLDAKRSVVNIASFMRFASDWQAASPTRTLADFIGYLDAYKSASGELPTSVELSEDVEGVRLMTLYQAKGLEFPIVVVPQLLEGEWPVADRGQGWFPTELLREAVPVGDLHIEEERRLLYVAMTRAQQHLVLTTYGQGQDKAASRFIGELLEQDGPHLHVTDRTTTEETDTANEAAADDTLAAALTAARRVMPLPSVLERRLALRLRAAELVSLLESTGPEHPETAEARQAITARLADAGRSAAMTADAARAAGLDPLTFREVALDSGEGANLLRVSPLPPRFSYSALSTYEACPLRYAFSYVYRIPPPEKPVGALTFGSTAHAAFEQFTKERRERLARGEEPPTREDLNRIFAANWKPSDFGDTTTEQSFARRVGSLLDSFWTGELSSSSEALHEELDFTLVLDTPDGTPPVRIYGSIDRVDRLPSGGIEVVDYKTGKISSQKDVHENLQLTIYALACRDALGLGTPELVTLYFTESSTRMSTARSDEELDAARLELLERVKPIRAGNFAANPGGACRYCDYTAICSERKVGNW